MTVQTHDHPGQHTSQTPETPRLDALRPSLVEALERTTSTRRLLVCTDIRCDARYQRPLSEVGLRRLIPFNDDIAGAIRVNRRTDGSLWVMDGQHRLAAAMRVGRAEVLCDVYHVTYEREAAFWYYWNVKISTVTKLDAFKALLEMGDPDACEIRTIVHQAGYEMRFTSGPRSTTEIVAIDTLERIYRRGGLRRPDLLRAVLTTMMAAWPTVPGSASTTMLKALGTIYERHASTIDRRRLVTVLRKHDPRILETQAKAAAQMAGQLPVRALIDLLLRLYNTRLRPDHKLGSAE